MPAEVPAAATTALHGLLTSPLRPAEVRGVFPGAVYVDTGINPGHEIVAVVTIDALRLPCSLVIAAHSRTLPFASLTVGDPATVGAGRVVTHDQHFAVRRWQRPRRSLTLQPGPGLAARSAALAALLPDPAHPLPATSPEELVGLGPGLTPAGDDVLAALLLTLTAAPSARRHLDRLTSATAPLLPRTTSLSATLLRHAAAGRGIPEVLDLVDALTGVGDLERAALRLLGVGHSSGPALAHGVLEAIRLINDASADPSTERAA